MKTYKEFINESSLWKYYDTAPASGFVELTKGAVKPVFMILETGDPEIEKFVTVFYDGFTNMFIVSPKISFIGNLPYDFRRKFLSFDYDRHSESVENCYETDNKYEAFTLCQLLAAFGEKDNIEKYYNLIEDIAKVVQKKYHPEFSPIKSFEKDIAPLVKDWEDSWEEQIPVEILSKLGLPKTFIASRKFGLN